MYRIILCYFVFFMTQLYSTTIPEKVLICGIARNVEFAISNSINSINELGSHFQDYRVIIYENSSKDNTRKLFQNWAKRDPRVIFLSEKLTKEQLIEESQMKIVNRTETIARARNKVLDIAMNNKYSDYKYVIWADLDFMAPWDIPNVLDTILNEEQQWDAVLANGQYDVFALRDEEFPIGFELIGDRFWKHLGDIRSKFILDKQGPWRKVYSAFGGLGIYKREAIKGCRYSGVVTRDLEILTLTWLKKVYEAQHDFCFLNYYQELLATTPVINLYTDYLIDRKDYPDEIGMVISNNRGLGKIAWFSCTPKKTLPWTCEHVTFHATMILRGHDKIFINPRLISNP